MSPIPFNIPPYIGNEENYIKQAVANHKICGDGEFTKKCNSKLEEMTGAKKALITTSGTAALEISAIHIPLFLLLTLLCSEARRLFLSIFALIR